MRNAQYKTLFASIRAKCQQRHWFGIDYDDPHQYEGILEHDPHFDVQSIRIAPPEDPRYTHFAYLPASEELMERSEKELGFVLPPLLRALYMQVANGGVGPGLGIQDVLEGYGKPGDSLYLDSDDTIVADYKRRRNGRIVDLNEYEGQWSQYNNLALPTGVWPDKLLPLCDLGCVQHACIASDEQMYLVAASEKNEECILARMCLSFEDWLWAWLKDDIHMVCYGRDTEQERIV